MSSQQFPVLRPGQMPSRQHFNRINKVSSWASGLFDRAGKPNNRTGREFHQYIMEITNTKIDGSDTADSGLYLAKIIWYSSKDEEWKDDETKEWVVDANGLLGVYFSEGNRVVAFWDGQRAAFVPLTTGSLVELMLAENHPGKSIVYRAYLGIWCPNHNDWRYDCTDTSDEWVYAIDHRYDVPYPNVGARGLYISRPSDQYGVIYENVNMDCSTPGTCASQNINQPC